MDDVEHRRSLLEREKELEVLGEVLRRAGDGDGGLMVVQGPAGIGKSSLPAACGAEAARVKLASTTRVHRVRVKPNASIPWVAGFQAESVLTCREQQIAVLAASGRPDAAIGADLAISVRTVQNHLSHIYRKLDVTSRRDLPDALMLGTEK